MTNKLMGLMVGAAMVMGGTALAGGDKWQEKKDQQSQTEMKTGEGVGGSGHMGKTEKESHLTGEILKSDKNALYVKTDDGAVVHLKVEKDTQFQAANVKSAKDLKEGQQVRASFEVKGMDNIAKSISMAQGMGGSGFESLEEPAPMQEPLPTEEPATGGAGEVEIEQEPGLEY